jgi:hypothetical protein
VSRRTLLYLGIAVAVVVAGSLASRRTSSRQDDGPTPSSSPSADDRAATSPSALAAPFPVPAEPPPTPFRRPATAVAEYGVLTTRTEDELKPTLDREKLVALVTADLCGDTTACDAVRALLRDPDEASIEVFASSVWNAERIDIDASARGLSAADRASVARLPRVIAVRVSGPVDSKQLPLRASLAATAAIARAVNGLVWDQLLERLEKAPDFAKHAVTTPLDAPCFRRDRVELLYEPKTEGIVRVLTSGLSRWGAPDIEAAAVPTSAAPQVAEVVLAIGRAIANGAQAGPLSVTRDDLAAARGKPYPPTPGLPAATAAVSIEVVGVHPENGDPNDFMARVVPLAGEGPIGYVDLAERFFGPLLAAAPGEDVLEARRSAAQEKLTASLAKWDATKASGSKLVVMVPFAIPGDAGTESMWLEVTRYDARTVTGTVLDDPLGATDVTRGSSVTRPRIDVEDVELRVSKP